MKREEKNQQQIFTEPVGELKRSGFCDCATKLKRLGQKERIGPTEPHKEGG